MSLTREMRLFFSTHLDPSPDVFSSWGLLVQGAPNRVLHRETPQERRFYFKGISQGQEYEVPFLDG